MFTIQRPVAIESAAMVHTADDLQIHVIIPCFNEAQTVGTVIEGVRTHLPEAGITVIDNHSTDQTGEVARRLGAKVLFEGRSGKGFAVRRALELVDADIYVIVDGDCTYDLTIIRSLIEPVASGRTDMVVGRRISDDQSGKAYRPFHTSGNRLVTRLINLVFRSSVRDVMSGYRVFSREVVRTLPLESKGFELETEWTAQMLDKGRTILEIDARYTERPPGSHSKLRTARDGFWVLWTIFRVMRDYKPLTLFGGLGLVFAVACGVCGWFPVAEYWRTGLILRLPLALLAGFLGTISFVLILTGVILNTIAGRFRELHGLIVRGRLAERARDFSARSNRS